MKIYKISEYGINKTIKILIARIYRKIKELIEQICDTITQTYTEQRHQEMKIKLKIKNNEIYCDNEFIKKNQILSLNYLKHQFNLLGSGWVDADDQYLIEQNVSLNNKKFGYEVNYSNRRRHNEISSILPTSYNIINWHTDLKSGYRWDVRKWYKNISYRKIEPADIKFPWELSRMQHLLTLALSYKIDNCEKILEEYQNQIVDFVSNNPPRYGVNWKSTMDVSIRLVNWLIAYDMIKSSHIDYDKIFDNIFLDSCYEHYQHIIKNIDYTESDRGNHYLSNIVALVFYGQYFESDKTIQNFAFAVSELFNEIDNQFNDDGSNYESSIYYHLLSSEFIAYTIALILGISEETFFKLLQYDDKEICLGRNNFSIKISDKIYLDSATNRVRIAPHYVEKINQIVSFMLGISDHNYQIPQIGDNDSGKLFKINPLVYDKKIDNFKYSDVRLVLDAFSGFIEIPGYTPNVLSLEKQLSSILANNNCILQHSHEIKRNENVAIDKKDRNNIERIINIIDDEYSVVSDTEIIYPQKYNIDTINMKSYEDMGIYIYKTQGFYLAIRCGYRNQIKRRGHAHHDQLSLTLSINEKYYYKDPGSLTYTSSKKIRNLYRSSKAHNVPYDLEIINPNSLFEINDILGECLDFSPNLFIGRVKIDKKYVYRIVKINKNKLNIIDILPKSLDSKYYPKNIKLQHSLGYGELCKETRWTKIW